MNSNNIIIENLGPCVAGVVTSGIFGNGAPGVACIHFQGSNVTITNNQFVWDKYDESWVGYQRGRHTSAGSTNSFLDSRSFSIEFEFRESTAGNYGLDRLRGVSKSPDSAVTR